MNGNMPQEMVVAHSISKIVNIYILYSIYYLVTSNTYLPIHFVYQSKYSFYAPSFSYHYL